MLADCRVGGVTESILFEQVENLLMFSSRKTIKTLVLINLPLLLLLILCQAKARSDSQAEPTLNIEFNISKACGLLRFISGVAKQSDEGTAYYDYLQAHHKLSKDDKHFIHEYQWLRKSKAQFSTSSGRKLNFHQQLMALACNSKSLEDFYIASKRYCSEDEHEVLKQVMEHFRPIYEQLIWRPLSPQLNKDLFWYRDNEKSFARPLQSIARLFDSSAGAKQPLKATFVPVPVDVRAEGNGFCFSSNAFSENLDSVVVVSQGIVPPDLIAEYKDKRVNNDRTLEDSDEIIHEFVHNLWSYRNSEFRQKLESLFLSNDRQFNYDLLNESQAAAIQAWFYKQVRGKDKSGPWYDNKYVDKYAKALLPVILEFVDSRKDETLNAEQYAGKAFKAFDQTFPEWREDPQIQLWRCQIVQSPLSSEDLADELNEKIFEFSSGEHRVSLVKGETWPDRYKNYLKEPHLTTAFLIYPNQLDVLQKYFELDLGVIRDLKAQLEKNKNNDLPLVKAFRSDTRCLVFSIAAKQALQKQALIDYARPGK